MTLVRPFPARLVKQEYATNVVCPMHDALSSAQRANLLLENPLSYLNVIPIRDTERSFVKKILN